MGAGPGGVRRARATPPEPPPPGRRIALALAGGAAVVAIGLSPAGAEVGDFVSDVIGIDEEQAKPALRSLPAAGELLVELRAGSVGRSRRRLEALAGRLRPGDLVAARPVPRGHRRARADRGRSRGHPRWTITRPRRARSRAGRQRCRPRIAYRTGGDLWVVAGRRHRRAPSRPRRRTPSRRRGGRSAPRRSSAAPLRSHALSTPPTDRRIRTIDADTGERLPSTPSDARADLHAPAAGGRSVARLARRARARRDPARPRSGNRLVVRSRRRWTAALSLRRPRATSPGRPGRPTAGGCSSAGREADQWLFIRAERPHRLVAIDRISAQFDPGGDGSGRLPRPLGWILPER